MRKATFPQGFTHQMGAQAVTIEPLPGHSDEEVVAFLEESGASDITVLAPGFISAQADGQALSKVEEIASIHVKTRHQPHSRWRIP